MIAIVNYTNAIASVVAAHQEYLKTQSQAPAIAYGPVGTAATNEFIAACKAAEVAGVRDAVIDAVLLDSRQLYLKSTAVVANN